MVDDRRARIERLSTGIPNLDDILHGGFPAGSLNIICGGPGTCKSTLALQMLFHQARLGTQSIYFTSIAEPAIKYLRYMQQFDFFDPSLVDKTVFFLDLSAPALSQGLEMTVETLQRRVEEKAPAIIAIDSFKALRSRLQDQAAAHAILYNLAVNTAVSGVTSFLVGEYTPEDIEQLPEFFAADGIVNLSTNTEGLRAYRLLEVLKLRGSEYAAGRHFFEITSAGITVYPRLSVPTEQEAGAEPLPRVPTGVPGLDEMLGGGLPARTSTVLEGGTGTGKTTIALTYLVEGAHRGEPGLLFTMDETREQLVEMAGRRGWDLPGLISQGLLEIVYTSPLEVASDALLQRARELVERMRAKRVVIDSLTSLNLSIASEGRGQALVYALAKAFRALGVTSVMTNETPELLGSTELAGRGLSSMADNIVMLRYVEIEARLARAIAVLKVRGSEHEHLLRELLITAEGVRVGEPFTQFRGVLTGVPTLEQHRPTPPRRGGTRPSESQ